MLVQLLGKIVPYSHCAIKDERTTPHTYVASWACYFPIHLHSLKGFPYCSLLSVSPAFLAANS
jgi:hypothetical protein